MRGLVLSVVVVSTCLFGQNGPYQNKLSPYVASPPRVVTQMLEMASLKPGETLYDLGCGDGRILIAAVENYKVKAVGVEISPKLVEAATARVQKAGLTSEVRIIQGDLLEVDLSAADAVAIYLSTPLNEQLRPRLEKYLKPGARVVSHDYAIRGWKPTKIQLTDDLRKHHIYLYEMPPVKE